MTLALARVVSGVHTMIVVFSCVAWALPWTWAMWVAVIAYPVIQLNWWVFDNRCILTVLEEKLRGPGAKRHAADDEPLNFVAELGSRILGRPVPGSWANVASYAVIWWGFAVVSVRLFVLDGSS